MPKRIAVCCDGTWNTPDQKEDGQVCPTNVVKMASAIAPAARDGTPQVVFYHAGVGSSSGTDLSHWVGGAFGVGLSEIIQSAYHFLVNNYVEGDDLYLFGFSRGAYAARSLAGLIRNCGLLRKVHADKIPDAYGLYRRSDAPAEPDGEEAKAFRGSFSREVKIKFIGVWDTVGALGIPDHILNHLTDDLWQFHDVKLSRIVENAYHALAIDERRQDFRPTLWEQQPSADGQKLEQVWFAGVHCNVGGGYLDSELSDIAFLWMQEKAKACGLEFDQAYIGAKIKPSPAGALRDSKTGLFHLRRDFTRPIAQGRNTQEFVHSSALARMEHANVRPVYQPDNLRNYLAVNGRNGVVS
jgi:uncharacterized protein (DUF2235 family)